METNFYIIAFTSALCLGFINSLPSNLTNLEVKAPETDLVEPSLQITFNGSIVHTSNTSITTVAPTTTSATPNTSSTTVAPTTSTTTVAPTTTSATPTTSSTTVAPTASTTTVAPTKPTTPATSIPSTITVAPTKFTTYLPSTVPQHTTEAPLTDRQFDGPSFIGGIVLTVGLTAIAFIAFKYFRASRMGKEPDYRNL